MQPAKYNKFQNTKTVFNGHRCLNVDCVIPYAYFTVFLYFMQNHLFAICCDCFDCKVSVSWCIISRNTILSLPQLVVNTEQFQALQIILQENGRTRSQGSRCRRCHFCKIRISYIICILQVGKSCSHMDLSGIRICSQK